MLHDYEMLWRPTYEAHAALGWASGALASVLIVYSTSLPSGPFMYMAGFAVLMALYRGKEALQHMIAKRSLAGKDLEFIAERDLVKITKNNINERLVWMGRGFRWEQTHAQRIYEIKKRVLTDTLEDEQKELEMGASWIHGVEPKESDINIPIKHLEGHTIVFGTTGAGKTRCYDLMITQAVLRNEPVLIIDPKGDKGLRVAAQRACEIAGRPEAFVHFHPAFPSLSYSIDPLRNWNRTTEIASRIAALIKSEEGMDPFVSFSWMALNNIANGLIMTHGRPNLVTLRRYIESGVESLLIQTYEAYFALHRKAWEDEIQAFVERFKAEKSSAKLITAYHAYYKKYLQEKQSSSEIEGLLSMYQHDRDHFSKMIASLLPMLNMLTSEPLRSLLSPEASNEFSTNENVTNPRTDSARMIEMKQVVYIGLDSLSDNVTGSAIGSIILADLASVAGDRYNADKNSRVNIFVDEASEIVNDQLIQMLNKGRGAGYQLTVATQSFSDFAAATGSADKARQLIGNLNNLISLRIKDGETQEFVTETFGKTIIRQVMHTQSTNAIAGDRDPTNWSGGYGERLIETEADLFDPVLLGKLPNLEYIASFSGGKIYKGVLPILETEKQPELSDMCWVRDKIKASA